MSYSKLAKSLCAAGVFAWLFLPVPAAAQSTPWQVNCLEARVCELKSEILQGETVAARLSIFHVRGHFFLQYTIPAGLDLAKGISLAIDEGPQQPTLVSSCTGFGCTGLMDLSTNDVQAMIAGQSARIFFTSPTNLDVFAIGFDLAGFTAGFEELTSR